MTSWIRNSRGMTLDMNFNIAFRYFNTKSLKITAFTTDNFQRSFQCVTFPFDTGRHLVDDQRSWHVFIKISRPPSVNLISFPRDWILLHAIILGIHRFHVGDIFSVSPVILFEKIVLSNQYSAHSIMIIAIIVILIFSSIAQLCPTLCDPMNRSTPGLPVHLHLPEFTQTHVHRVHDAV